MTHLRTTTLSYFYVYSKDLRCSSVYNVRVFHIQPPSRINSPTQRLSPNVSTSFSTQIYTNGYSNIHSLSFSHIGKLLTWTLTMSPPCFYTFGNDQDTSNRQKSGNPEKYSLKISKVVTFSLGRCLTKVSVISLREGGVQINISYVFTCMCQCVYMGVCVLFRNIYTPFEYGVRVSRLSFIIGLKLNLLWTSTIVDWGKRTRFDECLLYRYTYVKKKLKEIKISIFLMTFDLSVVYSITFYH